MKESSVGISAMDPDDIYEHTLTYYEGLTSKEAHLFSAGAILMLSNYVESSEQFFNILTEVKNILFETEE